MKRVINFFKNKKVITIATSIFVGCAIALPFILIGVTQSQNKYRFVMGNYDSYISPKVKNIFNQQYRLTINTYESSDQVAINFKKNTMDCAIVPAYEAIQLYNQGLILEIDWSRFKQFNPSFNETDPSSLFWSLPNNILKANNQNIDLLKWSIPYFCQNLVFVYRGNEIASLSKTDVTWKDIMDVVKNDKRFNSSLNNNNLPSIGLINDQRTLYSLSQIINDNNDITPINNSSINELENGYIPLKSNFINYDNDNILLSDSNTLLNQIALNQLNGAIIYNGDALFSSFGGDYSVNGINSNNFHVVAPKQSLLALDVLVINKNISNDLLNDFYSMANDLCIDFKDINSLSYINFEYVGYTPCLNSLYDFVKNNNGDYFNNVQLQQKILEINSNQPNQSNVENPINELTKSNLSFAYVWFKSNIGK